MKKIKLKNISNIQISSVDKKIKEKEKTIKLCNFIDVYKNWAITKENVKSFMIASAKDKEIELFSLKKGQVSFTKDSETRNDIGVSCYIADDLDNTILGYHCVLITPNKDILNGKYLNTLMHTKYMQKYFENNASGSGQRYTLSIDTINSIPVLLPSSLNIQEQIGNIFSIIDRKIEVNNKINKELEQTAKDLYDYWFVQFDFPDENKRPVINCIFKLNEKISNLEVQCA